MGEINNLRNIFISQGDPFDGYISGDEMDTWNEKRWRSEYAKLKDNNENLKKMFNQLLEILVPHANIKVEYK